MFDLHGGQDSIEWSHQIWLLVCLFCRTFEWAGSRQWSWDCNRKKRARLEAPYGWCFQIDLWKVIVRWKFSFKTLLHNTYLSNFLKQFCQSNMYLYSEPNSSNVISPLLSLSNMPCIIEIYQNAKTCQSVTYHHVDRCHVEFSPISINQGRLQLLGRDCSGLVCINPDNDNDLVIWEAHGLMDQALLLIFFVHTDERINPGLLEAFSNPKVPIYMYMYRHKY